MVELADIPLVHRIRCINRFSALIMCTEWIGFSEVRNNIVYIIEDLIIFFCQWFYNTAARGSLMQPQNVNMYLSMFIPSFL